MHQELQCWLTFDPTAEIMLLQKLAAEHVGSVTAVTSMWPKDYSEADVWWIKWSLIILINAATFQLSSNVQSVIMSNF